MPSKLQSISSGARMRQSARRRTGTALLLLALMLLVLSLSACGTICPAPEPTLPKLPEIPLIATPQPSVSYSINAQTRIKSWRDQLTATPLIPSP